MKSAPRVLVGNPEGKVPFGDLRHRGKVILKWILNV
jgi:hypothetical protein